MSLAFKELSVALFGGVGAVGGHARPGGAAAGAPGGQAAIFGDTWDWDGKLWTQRQDMGPRPRCFHTMTHDVTRDRLVLFGGTSSAGMLDALNDTWEAPGDPITLIDFTIAFQGPGDNLAQRADGSVTLSSPAAPDGVVVLLSAPGGGVNASLVFGGQASLVSTGPWNLNIPGGDSTAAFRLAIPLFPVPPGAQFSFTATLGDVSKTVVLTY
jgi:hypothetical protein